MVDVTPLLPAFIGAPERNRVYNCDALTLLRALPSGSVNCIVTSPPYFGLRDYGVEGQIGLEETPAQFIAALVEIFHEAKRVLRDDGTMWVNMGDSYNSAPAGKNPGGFQGAAMKRNEGYDAAQPRKEQRGTFAGLPEKSLLGMPWRLAFALQDDGWILRSDIIWHKPNPMPESVTDRPTKSHEYVFLFAKSAKYWYDADAIREPLTEAIHKPGNKLHPDKISGPNNRNGHSQWEDTNERAWGNPLGRNKRSVWEVPTEPNSFAHFATFPQALITPMILAGCPDKTCVKCGAPWVRVTDVTYTPSDKSRGKPGNGAFLETGAGNKVGGWNDYPSMDKHVATKGFEPTCSCNGATRPGLTLDPFMGSGTTGLVARAQGRDYIGSELNSDYVAIARERLRKPYDPHYITPASAPLDDLPLFAQAAANE